MSKSPVNALGFFWEYEKVRRVCIGKIFIQSIDMEMQTMFTADGFFWVLLIVVVFIAMKWHTRARLKKIIQDGGFAYKGKYYDVYYLGRADNPKAGLPEALLDPDNGAFAPDTLSKVKWLSEGDKKQLSTVKDQYVSDPKSITAHENMLNEIDEMLLKSD